MTEKQLERRIAGIYMVLGLLAILMGLIVFLCWMKIFG